MGDRTTEDRISGKLALALAESPNFNLAGSTVEIDCDTYQGDEPGETCLYIDHGGQRYEVRVVVVKSDAVTVTDRVRGKVST